MTARVQHYAFVHQMLRDVALQDPLQFLIAMGLPNAEQKLRNIWNKMAEETQDGISDAELALQADTGSPASLILLTLPPPAEPGEAYFVAVVVVTTPAPPTAAFFTLERSFGEGDDAVRMLCEWRLDDDGPTHLNHGPLAALDRQAFMRAVGLVLRARGAGDGGAGDGGAGDGGAGDVSGGEVV